MKKSISFFLILINISIFAQEQLIVNYVVDAYYEMSEKTKNKMGGMELESIPSDYVLRSTPTESEFEFIPKVNNSQSFESGANVASFQMSSNGILYMNTEDNNYLTTEVLGNKKYSISLVSDKK